MLSVFKEMILKLSIVLNHIEAYIFNFDVLLEIYMCSGKNAYFRYSGISYTLLNVKALGCLIPVGFI